MLCVPFSTSSPQLTLSTTEILIAINTMFEYHIDFKGQCLAEQITQGVISAFGVIGFLVGFFLQDIRLSLYVFTAGIVLAGLLVIPAWPYLNKSSIQWLPSREKAAAAAAAAATAQQESSKAGKEKST